MDKWKYLFLSQSDVYDRHIIVVRLKIFVRFSFTNWILVPLTPPPEVLFCKVWCFLLFYFPSWIWQCYRLRFHIVQGFIVFLLRTFLPFYFQQFVVSWFVDSFISYVCFVSCRKFVVNTAIKILFCFFHHSATKYDELPLFFYKFVSNFVS